MNEFNPADATPEQIAQARPASASLQIILEDGSTDTIQLSGPWAAKLVKMLRTNAPSGVSLYGCLPEDSQERPSGQAGTLSNPAPLSIV